jgi:ectoine hydroxylase-related dioxygenase (phytanoyl-CoA dioxygenase family)
MVTHTAIMPAASMPAGGSGRANGEQAGAAPAVLEEFYREGFALIRGVLSAEEAGRLRELADRFIDDPAVARDFVTPVVNTQVLRSTQALDRAFADLLVREPMVSLAEAVLGPNLAFCGQNVIRSDQSAGITHWHVDDLVEFPLPENVTRHDARVRLPVFWFSFQIALSDIDSPETGPTEGVPGSHYSGRQAPAEESARVFEGRRAVPILCKAGDAYLFNHQLWHHGSTNRSARRRYLMQNQYCRAWGPYRFNSPDAARRLSDEKMAGASERLSRLLEPTRRVVF